MDSPDQFPPVGSSQVRSSQKKAVIFLAILLILSLFLSYFLVLENRRLKQIIARFPVIPANKPLTEADMAKPAPNFGDKTGLSSSQMPLMVYAENEYDQESQKGISHLMVFSPEDSVFKELDRVTWRVGQSANFDYAWSKDGQWLYWLKRENIGTSGELATIYRGQYPLLQAETMFSLSAEVFDFFPLHEKEGILVSQRDGLHLYGHINQGKPAENRILLAAEAIEAFKELGSITNLYFVLDVDHQEKHAVVTNIPGSMSPGPGAGGNAGGTDRAAHETPGAGGGHFAPDRDGQLHHPGGSHPARPGRSGNRARQSRGTNRGLSQAPG